MVCNNQIFFFKAYVGAAYALKMCNAYEPSCPVTNTEVLLLKIESIFFPSVLTCVLGSQKNLLLETVLLITHNTCFGFKIKFKF